MQLRMARNDEGEPEIFRSLQGEGPMAGRARTFVRLSGCNLHCVWCDTAYTWNWQGSAFPHQRDAPGAPHKFDPSREMMKVDVADVAARVRDLGDDAIVLTGGEPLMQAEAVAALISALREDNRQVRVEMETNGSLAPGGLAQLVDLFVVSPKLAHSGNDKEVALKDPALATFAALEIAVFKFVARARSDIDEAAALLRPLGVAPSRVMIMPEGTDSETLRQRAATLAPAILAHGFAYSDRLHVHLYGARRGV